MADAIPCGQLKTGIKFMYNWVPMVMCVIIFEIFLTSFNVDRGLAKLRNEKGTEAEAQADKALCKHPKGARNQMVSGAFFQSWIYLKIFKTEVPYGRTYYDL